MATALAAGRTISGTGEATFTTGAFDGTGNVSGAVTLLNSAVISKVLTGYASGPGVVATDSILAAIQKIKREYCPKMDAVTAANYKAGVTAAGVGMELTLYSHFLIHQ
jgi:hypothetical protein